MKFVQSRGLTAKTTIRVETHVGYLTLTSNSDGNVTVGLGTPFFDFESIPMSRSEKVIEFEGVKYDFQTVSLGNPHAVLWLNAIEQLDIEPLAKQFQTSALFPESVNVGFAQFINKARIKLRVYERGSGETLACGSGACAAVIAGIQQKKLSQCVQVDLRGGSVKVEWTGGTAPVYLSGPAQEVFSGQINVSAI